MRTISLRLATLATALLVSQAAQAAPALLTNGSGDGTVTVGVDGYGAFGSSIGTHATDAIFDPVGGSPAAAGTSFESGVAIRFGTSGSRSFLTSGAIGSSGSLTNPTVTGSATSASSSFLFGGLSFELVQTLTALESGGVQTGSMLTQTYVITNTGTSSSSFELLRYLDGDLNFDGGIVDGGGRLLAGSTEILFETDSATGSSTSTTFVGISAEGGTIPVGGRYEIDTFAGLRDRIIAGTALDDGIAGDSADIDQFIDTGFGYDVTLALRNLYSLDAGASATYVTRTYFGQGAPEDIPTGQLPEPGSLALIALALAGAVGARRRKA